MQLSGPLTATKMNMPKKTRKANWTLTLTLVLMIFIVIMGILVAKKYFEVGRQVDPQEMAIKELEKQVNKHPEDVQSRTSLAFGLQSNGNYDAAREQYEEVLKVDPENPGALYNLAEVSQATQDIDGAIKLLVKLRTKYPDHVLGNLKLSQLYVDQKKYDEAIKIVDAMMVYTSARDKVEFYLVKGKAWEMKGDKVKAKTAYNKVLTFVPDNKEASEALARLK